MLALDEPREVKSNLRYAALITTQQPVPPVGSDQIFVHHHEEYGQSYKNDFRAASFRGAHDNLNVLVFQPWANEENVPVTGGGFYLVRPALREFVGSYDDVMRGLKKVRKDKEYLHGILASHLSGKRQGTYEHDVTQEFMSKAAQTIEHANQSISLLSEVKLKLQLAGQRRASQFQSRPGL